MQASDLFTEALQQATIIIDQVTDEDLAIKLDSRITLPTVTHLLAHMLGEVSQVQAVISGSVTWEIVGSPAAHSVEDALKVQVAWNAASETARRAFAMAPMQAVISTSLDELTVEEYKLLLSSDLIFRTWDLAQAIQVPMQLGQEFVESMYAFLLPMQRVLHAMSIFGQPIPLPDGCSLQDRLIALSGRQPK